MSECSVACLAITLKIMWRGFEISFACRDRLTWAFHFSPFHSEHRGARNRSNATGTTTLPQIGNGRWKPGGRRLTPLSLETKWATSFLLRLGTGWVILLFLLPEGVALGSPSSLLALKLSFLFSEQVLSFFKPLLVHHPIKQQISTKDQVCAGHYGTSWIWRVVSYLIP